MSEISKKMAKQMAQESFNSVQADIKSRIEQTEDKAEIVELKNKAAEFTMDIALEQINDLGIELLEHNYTIRNQANEWESLTQKKRAEMIKADIDFFSNRVVSYFFYSLTPNQKEDLLQKAKINTD